MNDAAVGVAVDGQFVAGLLIGVFLGLLVGPILRSWLAWREWVEASREADLTERFLARWEEEGARSDGGSSAKRASPRGGRVRSGGPSSAPPITPSGAATPDGEGSAA